jgi:ABC-2 type transport system ATP-binding protein
MARESEGIVVVGLRKTYPSGVEAVKGIDFTVAPGEVFGLVGPNGAGKSTTIGMLTTQVMPSGGRASVAGFDVATEAIDVRRVSSVVFQESVLDRSLTGRRNLDIHARLWGIEPRIAAKRVKELAVIFDLVDVMDRPVDTYSGGQRRRLEIARALLSKPRVLFLDEPTVGLDPLIRHELVDIVADLRARTEMTVVVTTHYLEEAERLCDRVAVMHDGAIVGLDTPQALLATLGAELVELRVNEDPLDVIDLLKSHRIAGDDAFAVGGTITVPLHRRRTSRALAVIDELELDTTSVSTRRPTLDDVYLRLTGNRIDR